MVRGRRRRLPGAQSAVRWVAADARDVARIHGSSAGPAVAFPGDVSVATVEGGLARWQRRVERRRLLAVGRRGALLGVGAACLLQLGALASGNDGSGLWLLPAVVPGRRRDRSRPRPPHEPGGRRAPARSRSRARRRGQHRARARDVRGARGEWTRPRRARARRRPRVRSAGASRGHEPACSRDVARRRCWQRSSPRSRPCCSRRVHARPLPPRRRQRRRRRRRTAL